MGCDIHIIVERKYGDEWVGLQEETHVIYWEKNSGGEWARAFRWNESSRRDYDAFAKLAGVRGQGPEAKGLPADMSQLTRVLYGGNSDYHSHSWCTPREFFEAKVSSMPNPAEALLAAGHPAVTHPFGYWFGMYEPEEGEEYRIVFCFDN